LQWWLAGRVTCGYYGQASLERRIEMPETGCNYLRRLVDAFSIFATPDGLGAGGDGGLHKIF
jgi:hypothetical protein